MVERLATSEPAPGSEKSWHQISSPVKSGRSHFAFCASVPWAATVGAPMPRPMLTVGNGPPAATTRWVTIRWSPGATPRPPNPTGNDTLASPRSYIAPMNSAVSPGGVLGEELVDAFVDEGLVAHGGVACSG